MKEIFKRIFLVVASLAASFILLEIGYQVYLKVVNPVTIYQPGGKVFSPGGKGIYRGGDVSLDKYGFRNSSDLSDREMKFLIIGDSVPFGLGINDDEVFTHLLNEDGRKTGIGFINLAHPGYDTIHLVRTFRKYEHFFRPYDAIIWFYNINDAKSSKKYYPSNIIYPDIKLGPYSVENAIWPYIKSPTLIKHLVSNLVSRYWGGGLSEQKDINWDFYYKACLATFKPGSVTAENEKKYLKEIIDFSRKIEIPLFFVLAPATDQFEDKDLRPQYFLKNFLYEYNYKLPILDLFSSWKDLEDISQYYLPDDHGHLNAIGHKLLAFEIKKFLIDNYKKQEE